MGKKQDIQIAVKKLLNELTLPERIDIIERVGKQLRQQNSIETAKEVDAFARKTGNKKNIDYSPVLKNK